MSVEQPQQRGTRRSTVPQLAATIGLVLVLLGLSVLAWFAVAESMTTGNEM